MELWHKIGIFVVGLIGLISYLISLVTEAIKEQKKQDSLENKKLRTIEQKMVFYFAFMAVVILFMFTIPKLLGDLITYLFPDPEKTSMQMIIDFYKMLLYLGERHFNDETYFFKGRGLMMLEWFFILLPYLIGLMIWSIKTMLRNLRLKT